MDNHIVNWSKFPAEPLKSASTPTLDRPLADNWTKSSWRTKTVHQDVKYPDSSALDTVLNKIEALPPLVHVGEVSRLREQLKEVAEGKRFLLQGGDCAEAFHDVTSDHIESLIKVMLLQSLVLVWGARIPLVRIARIAGQYAKPRSKPTEVIDGKEVLSYRGDNVNGQAPSERDPDPSRLLTAHFHSCATLNYLRSMLSAGFADLHHADLWSLGHIKSPHLREEYQDIVTRLTDSLNFMKTVGADSGGSIGSVDIFTSHEGLMLEYEEKVTRETSEGVAYNGGAHFLWIGDRTRQITAGHVEYFRGILNPIGVKVGPTMEADELIKLLDILDPNFETGRVTLITRYGADKVAAHLGMHIDAVKRTQHKVVWCCDPMHGNTTTSSTGVKTRSFDSIIAEIQQSFLVHKQHGSSLNGLHLEMTGDKVTECIGGGMELSHDDLSINYQTACDPRLNYEQAIEVAFVVSKQWRS